MMSPGFPVANSAGDDVSHANLLHWSVTKNPNLSCSTFPSNSNTLSDQYHLTNPNPSYYSDELEHPSLGSSSPSSMAAIREMIFRIAALQPINIDPESVKTPKRKNVRISKDPQSVAARHRRERISERIRILQRIVPGGTKMDTASMLDEAIHYVKFLKRQVQSLEKVRGHHGYGELGLGFGGAAADQVWFSYDNLVSIYRMERGDVVSFRQGQASSGESYGEF